MHFRPCVAILTVQFMGILQIINTISSRNVIILYNITQCLLYVIFLANHFARGTSILALLRFECVTLQGPTCSYLQIQSSRSQTLTLLSSTYFPFYLLFSAHPMALKDFISFKRSTQSGLTQLNLILSQLSLQFSKEKQTFK